MLPLRKGGEKRFSHIEGGHKGGRERFYPVLRVGGGGRAKSFGPAIFPFCSPPSL